MRNRIVQNKYKKETELDENRSLRAENQKLRRDNKRLKKELNKLIARETQVEDDELPILVIREKCPSCNGENLVKLNLGVKRLMVCKDCKYRKTI